MARMKIGNLTESMVADEVAKTRDMIGMISVNPRCRGECKRHLKYAEKELRGVKQCGTSSCRAKKIANASYYVGWADAISARTRGRRKK